MKIEEKLQKLITLEKSGRCTGRTTVLIEGIKHCGRGVMVVDTPCFATNLQKTENISTISLNELLERKVMGHPVILDTYVQYEIMKEALSEIKRLEKELKKAQEYNEKITLMGLEQAALIFELRVGLYGHC